MTRLPPSLRALLILAVFIALLASIGGASILYFGYQRPDIVQPRWESGQHVMLFGLVSLVIDIAIIFQVRRMLSGHTKRAETPTI
jgi:hypothetical protein